VTLSKILLSIAYILIITGVLFLLQRVYQIYRISIEYTRKIAHVSIGLISLVFIFLLDNVLLIGLLCAGGFAFLLFTRLRATLNFVHKVKRRSLGSVIYPMPFIICYIIAVHQNNMIFLYLPVLTFLLADSAATIVGLQLGGRSYTVFHQVKTLRGSLAFGITTFILTFFSIWLFMDMNHYTVLLVSFIIALMASAIEGISPFGLDNLTVPLFMVLAIKVIYLIGFI
jgi:phytol kinase